MPGQPDKSLLIQAVRQQGDATPMPPKGKLPERSVALLEEWVRRGVPFPGAAGAAVKSTVNLAEGRKFWSFQPPKAVAPPTTRDATWGKRRIDAFLLAAMEQRNLAPSPAASRAVLVRRATFDLIGGAAIDLGDANNRRRTIYGTGKRRELSDLLRLNDFPDLRTHSPARVPTTTPLQQLFTLNSPFMQQQAAALVKRLKTEEPADTAARVRRAYHLLFGRSATDAQVTLAAECLADGSDAVWHPYAQVLLGSNEFLFVD